MDGDKISNNKISKYMISEYTYHAWVWVRASEIKGGSELEGELQKLRISYYSGSLNAADRARETKGGSTRLENCTAMSECKTD